MSHAIAQSGVMTEAEIAHACLSCPGATRVVQWRGARVFKVGDKVFAILPADGSRLTLKCADPETAALLIEVGAARRAPHLPRGGWVSLDRAGTPDDEMRARVETSYRTVRASLPKSVRETLP